jgi:hypothetical protein
VVPHGYTQSLCSSCIQLANIVWCLLTVAYWTASCQQALFYFLTQESQILLRLLATAWPAGNGCLVMA